jgi:hypothetical protein
MLTKLIAALLFAILINWSNGLQFASHIEKNNKTRIIMLSASIVIAFACGLIISIV